MRLVRSMMKVNWSAPGLRAVDFSLAGGGLLAGLLMENGWLIGGGALGLVLAAVNPMGRMQRFMFGMRRGIGGGRR